MARLRWLRRSVENLVAGAGIRTRWLFVNLVFGMLVGGSVVLSEMARQLTGSRKQFRNVLNRLSRGLGSEQVHLGRIYRRYLRQAGPWTKKGYDVVALDMSEIVKPYGRTMENLRHVRDASETRSGFGL